MQAQGGDVARVDVPRILKEYQNERLMRVSMIHGMAGMAAFMASTYKCYLGEWSPRGEAQALAMPAPRMQGGWMGGGQYMHARTHTAGWTNSTHAHTSCL